MSHRLYSVAVGHIVDAAGNGDFTTVQAAINASSANETIFIRPGVYNEDLTLKTGVSLVGFPGDSHATIKGKMTHSTGGVVSICGLRLETEGDFSLVVSGSAGSVVNLDYCILAIEDNTFISFTSSNPSSRINLRYCTGYLNTTGITLYDSSSAGVLTINYCNFTNTGQTTTASTSSDGLVNLNNTNISFPVATSGTASIATDFCQFNTLAENVTALTLDGSGGHIITNCDIGSGSASAISVGGSLTITSSTINSDNAAAITGAGSIIRNGLSFSGSSSIVNVTTQTVTGAMYGATVAPTAGMIGQSITSTVSNIATTSTTTKSITNIVLTPGVWDISCTAQAVATGGTLAMQSLIAGISTTNNAFSGTAGSDHLQLNSAGGMYIMSISVPRVRATVTSNTTYYLSVQTAYTSTSCPVSGRISATRVG